MKINQKQLMGYKRAKTKWISANDEYNKLTFGITRKEYLYIKMAESSLNGICGTKAVNLTNINKKLVYIKPITGEY